MGFLNASLVFLDSKLHSQFIMHSERLIIRYPLQTEELKKLTY